MNQTWSILNLSKWTNFGLKGSYLVAYITICADFELEQMNKLILSHL